MFSERIATFYWKRVYGVSYAAGCLTLLIEQDKRINWWVSVLESHHRFVRQAYVESDADNFLKSEKGGTGHGANLPPIQFQ